MNKYDTYEGGGENKIIMEIKKADNYLDNLFLYKNYNTIVVSINKKSQDEYLKYLYKGSSLLSSYEILNLKDKNCFLNMGYSKNKKFLLPIICNKEMNAEELKTFIKNIIICNFNKFNKQFNSLCIEKLQESIETILNNINATFVYLGEKERKRLTLRADYLEKDEEEYDKE